MQAAWQVATGKLAKTCGRIRGCLAGFLRSCFSRGCGLGFGYGPCGAGRRVAARIGRLLDLSKGAEVCSMQRRLADHVDAPARADRAGAYRG